MEGVDKAFNLGIGVANVNQMKGYHQENKDELEPVYLVNTFSAQRLFMVLLHHIHVGLRVIAWGEHTQ